MTHSPPPFQPHNYSVPAERAPDAEPWPPRLIAWTVIGVSVVILTLSNWRESHAATAVGAAGPGQVGSGMQLVGRYVVGCRVLMTQTGTNADAAMQTLAAQMTKTAVSPVDRDALVVVVGELRGDQAAKDQLAAQPKPPAGGPRQDLEDTLRIIYTRGVQDISAEKRAALQAHLGWFAKLALTHGLPDADPARAAVLAGARQTVYILVGAMVGGTAALLLGLGLFVFFLIPLVDGRLVRHFLPTGRGGPFLEAFAIYLGGMTAVHALAPKLPAVVQASLAARIAILIVLTLVAMAWPLARGVGFGAWRRGLGWHAGRGFFREIAMGWVGYLAGLPILGVGFAITLALVKWSGEKPGHPIDQMLGGGDWKSIIGAFVLASVYAPLAEETLFRGAFFQALRVRHGWLISAGVSSFIFAAIHPQGWTVALALMSVAIAFAAIREWRGTILSSAAAHALHNGLLVMLMVSATQ